MSCMRVSPKGSFIRCANVQGIKSPAVPSRGVWLPAGAGGEQVDGRKKSRAAAVVSWEQAVWLQVLQFTQHPGMENRSPCPWLGRRSWFHRGSAEVQKWSAEGRAETQANTSWVLLPLTAFAPSAPSLSHKDFSCSHGQQFCLGRHPALLSRSKTTPHTFLKVWKKQPSWITSPPSGY